jgi:hypothetical protein
MPGAVIAVIVILGYIAMGVLLGSAVAYVDNRTAKEAMGRTDAAQLAFFTVFWPILLVCITFVGIGWTLSRGFKSVGRVGSAYARYLRYLGAPKQIP